MTWTLDSDGVLTISGEGEMEDGVIIDNHQLDTPWSDHIDSIRTLVIEEGVTNIGDCLFQSCSNLTSVTMPDTVTAIGDAAFRYCTSLSSVTFPKSITLIGSETFGCCTSLTSVALPDSILYMDGAFNGCTSLVSLNIPIGVWSCNEVVRDCSSLTSLTISSYIGVYSYSGCSSLKSIIIPEGVTFLDNVSFSDCTALTSVSIPVSTDFISPTAFSGCDSLKTVCYAGTETQWQQLDPHGTLIESSPNVVYLVKPLTITTHPDHQMSIDGTVSFAVAAKGDGLSYQWQYSADGGKNWSHTTLTGNNTDILSVTAQKSISGRQYRCVIFDKHGQQTISAPGIFTYGAQLLIHEQPQDQTVAQGAAVFDLRAEGVGLTYKWQYSANGGKTWANTSLNGCNTDTLTVTAQKSISGRLYHCVITDALGQTVTSRAALFTYGTPLFILNQPADQSALSGSVSFAVSAAGDGLTYQWQYRTAKTD